MGAPHSEVSWPWGVSEAGWEPPSSSVDEASGPQRGQTVSRTPSQDWGPDVLLWVGALRAHQGRGYIECSEDSGVLFPFLTREAGPSTTLVGRLQPALTKADLVPTPG